MNVGGAFWWEDSYDLVLYLVFLMGKMSLK